MSKRKRFKGKYWGGQKRPFDGYSDFRYGARPVSLAPILRGEARKSVISAVMDTLSDWRIQPFENEAAAVHGLRSGLCLAGHGFVRSELDAALIVSEALQRLGYQRPTWEQGQKEYTEPRENCSWCGGLLDPYRQRTRLCSAECARMVMLHRSYEDSARDDTVRRRATALVSKGRKVVRTCVHCGDEFRPWSNANEQRFCSKGCMYAFRDTEAAAVHEKACKWCGTGFVGKTPRALFCSPACQLAESRFRTGRLRQLTAPAFDYVMRMAA